MVQPFKRLHNAHFELEISPQMGGAIMNLTSQGVDILRPWNGEETVRKSASYPLVPFSNRIAEGQFSFEGKTYQLAKNFGDHPHTIHGIGWEHEWHYEALSDTKAKLSLTYKPEKDDDWPFAFDVTQTITLNDDSVRVEMQFTNTSESNAPVGLGWHPFFPRRDGIYLKTRTEKVWLNDERMLPKAHEVVPEAWNFSQGKSVGYVGSDNCYSGWEGKALIAWPNEGLSVTLNASKELSHLVFFTPSEPAPFIAVEPVMNANNAINKNDPSAFGMAILKPQESITVWMELHVKRAKHVI